MTVMKMDVTINNPKHVLITLGDKNMGAAIHTPPPPPTFPHHRRRQIVDGAPLWAWNLKDITNPILLFHNLTRGIVLKARLWIVKVGHGHW